MHVAELPCRLQRVRTEVLRYISYQSKKTHPFVICSPVRKVGFVFDAYESRTWFSLNILYTKNQNGRVLFSICLRPYVIELIKIQTQLDSRVIPSSDLFADQY